jgi:multiple sugar transport system substrate-binding protein
MSRRGSGPVGQQGLSRRTLFGNTAKVGVGLAGASLFSAAGPGAVRRASAQTEISMMGWGSPLEKENVDKGLQVFQQQHPEITVDWLHTPNEEYETKLKTAIAGGNAPDVFWASNMPDYVAQGVVLDITGQVAADPAIGAPDYFLQPQEQSRAVINDKWYGIGSCWVLHHLYYNKAMLDTAGVEPPSTDPTKAWTWDQFLEACRRLTLDSAGRNPDQDGFDSNDIQQFGVNWETWNLPRDVLVYSNEGEAYTSDYVCHLGEPAAIEAYQMLADLSVVHHVAPQAAAFTQMGFGNAWEAMASGRVAMLCDGSWALQDIAKLGIEFGCGVLPVLKKTVTEAQAHMHMISSTTEHPDEAWQLLAFLSSDDYQRGLCAAGLWLPSHSSLLTPEGLATWITPGVHPEGYEQIATDYLKNYAKNYFYPAGFSEANTLITSALDPVWIGDQTAEQAIVESGVLDQVAQILAENKERLDANV